VYNLEVETEHCYYVSIAGVLCHNINGCSVGKYGYLKDPPGVSKGREFSKEQRLTVLSENMKHNNGKLRCDQTGIFLTLEPGPTQAQVDHIMPKAAGGTNSYGNAQVLSRDANQAKGDSIP
jgi:5-methylcytosine-specific restriction endonuclease McrA